MLKASFILLTVAIAILMFSGATYAANKAYTDPKKQNTFKLKTAFFLLAWLAYISVMSINKVFENPSLPPRIPLLLILPYFIFIAYFTISKRFKDIIEVLPLSWLIYFQTFRIVAELLLFGLFMNHMVPWAATFEGYNFDIGIGITAPLIGFLVAKGRLSRLAIRAWNFLGIFSLFAVSAIMSTHAYRPWLWGEAGTILGKGFGTFPIIFLAGFFMPTAIFLHILSLVKTRKKSK